MAEGHLRFTCLHQVYASPFIAITFHRHVPFSFRSSATEVVEWTGEPREYDCRGNDTDGASERPQGKSAASHVIISLCT